MEYDPQDNDVIHLLEKLKESNGAYPQEMLALRRQGYLRQVAEISGAAGLVVGLKHFAKSGGKAAGLPSATGTIVEALLVIALVAEAGAVTYFYRDKIAQYFRSATNTPQVEEVSNPPVLLSPIPEIELTPSPIMTETGTLTPVATPSPELAADPTNQAETSNGINSQSASTQAHSASTQAPNLNPGVNNKGNNGNQYGLTPKPVRTKENGNNPVPNVQENNSGQNQKKKP